MFVNCFAIDGGLDSGLKEILRSDWVGRLRIGLVGYVLAASGDSGTFPGLFVLLVSAVKKVDVLNIEARPVVEGA